MNRKRGEFIVGKGLSCFNNCIFQAIFLILFFDVYDNRRESKETVSAGPGTLWFFCRFDAMLSLIPGPECLEHLLRTLPWSFIHEGPD